MKLKDKREFKAFLLAAQNSKFTDNSINPLYKETNTNYQNPMYKKVNGEHEHQP